MRPGSRSFKRDELSGGARLQPSRNFEDRHYPYAPNRNGMTFGFGQVSEKLNDVTLGLTNFGQGLKAGPEEVHHDKASLETR